MSLGNQDEKEINLMKYNFLETIMGAIVILVAAVFLIYGVNTVKVDSKQSKNIYAVFENASGLKIGDNVKISGINVGKIIKLELDTESYEAKVLMGLDQKIKLPEDTTARITSSSILGGNHIEIAPGISEILLKDEEIIYDTTSVVSFSDMLGKMIYSTNK